MSVWPSKGLVTNRNKRLHRIQFRWKSTERSGDHHNGANQIEKPKQNDDCLIGAENGNGSSINDNQSLSPASDVKSKKRSTKNGESGRNKKKKRNHKPANGHSPLEDDQKRLNGKDKNGGKGNGKVIGHKVVSESSDNVGSEVKRARRTRSYSRSIKSEESPISEKPKGRKGGKNSYGVSTRRTERFDNNNGTNGTNGTNELDDIVDGDEDDSWDGVRDAIGPVTRCSSSSSLSSSCSNSSLIKHYTNVIMNCCDNHFKEDCDFVRAKIDRILKAHWKDRWTRYKSKSSPSNDDNCSEKTDSQPSKQSSPVTDTIAFELRPARLPLNKKTWTKLRRSNRNSDWILNEES